MSKKIDKEMLKNPDVFINTSDHIFNFIEKHSKTFLAISLVALIVAVGMVTYNYTNSSHEQKAASAIYKVEAELKKAQSDVREERAKKVQSSLAGDKADKKASKNSKASKATKAKVATQTDMLRPADFAKDYAAVVNKLKVQIKAFDSTRAALVSAMNLAYFLSEQKQFPLALEVLQLAKFQPSNEDLLQGFYQMHRGLLLSENNQPDAALEAYNSVLKVPALKEFHAEALLKSGVAYQAKGDVNKARESYEKISHEFPETEANTTAQQYLRLLELKNRKQG